MRILKEHKCTCETPIGTGFAQMRIRKEHECTYKTPIGTGISQVRIWQEHECTCNTPVGTGVSKVKSERNMSVLTRLLLEQEGLPNDNLKET